VTWLPFWSVSRNAPPIAAACRTAGADRLPPSITIAPRHSARPARNAPSTIIRRVPRGLIWIRGLSEACCDAGEGHLGEHRAAIVCPQCHGAGDQHGRNDGGPDQDEARS